MTIDNLSLKDREYRSYIETSNGDIAVRTTATLETGDIELGAVEIKDSTTNNRVAVDGSGALKVTVLNPDYNHFTGVEHIIDEAKVDADTYRVIIHFDSYKNASLHLKGSGGVTFTIWGSNDSTADSSADTGWVDLSTKIMGSSSLVDSEDLYFIDSSFVVDRLMIKYVTSDSSNAVDAWVMKG